MAVLVEVPKTVIQHRGEFDYTGLMRNAKGWFDAGEYVFAETKHKLSKDGAESKIEVEMEGKKKINEYVRYIVKLLIRTWEMKEKDVIEGGQKVRKNEGRVAIDITANVELDWQNRFGGSKLMQGLQDFMHRFILKTTIEDVWKDRLFWKVRDLGKTLERSLGGATV
jgi:hypothetical protein